MVGMEGRSDFSGLDHPKNAAMARNQHAEAKTRGRRVIAACFCIAWPVVIFFLDGRKDVKCRERVSAMASVDQVCGGDGMPTACRQGASVIH